MTTPSLSAYETHSRFCRALHAVRSLPHAADGSLEPSTADKLSLYGLYKQASQGDCNVPRPSSRHVVEYAKWKAWDQMRSVSPVEAQRLYVDGITQLLTEFLQRHPHHEHAETIKQLLQYINLKDNVSDTAIDSLNDLEKDYDVRLMHIEPQQLTSPLPLNLSRGRRNSIHHYQQQQQQQHRYVPSEASPSLLSSSSTIQQEYPLTPDIYPSKRAATVESPSDVAIENLQTEVTALSEQIDKLRASVAKDDKERRQKQYWVLWLFKTLIKHAVVNSLILVIIFVVLWKRGSPVADAFIDYLKPRMQKAMRKLLSRVVLWRVTV